jgi:hypothetical protein
MRAIPNELPNELPNEWTQFVSCEEGITEGKSRLLDFRPTRLGHWSNGRATSSWFIV